MANAMVALANLTLSSTASTVTFGSIPATYRDLRLVMVAPVSSGTSDIWCRFNGDTGSNYTRVYAGGSGSGSGYSGTNVDIVNYFGYASSSNDSVNTLDIFDYAQTDKQKSNLAKASVASNSVTIGAGRWASTAAITSILISTPSNSFAAGSTFALYGIVSA